VNAILFCLENCEKCETVKEYFKNKKDISVKVHTFPKDYQQWNDNQKKISEEYNVLEDLQVTAPVLVVPDQCRLVGQLKIKQWINNGYEVKRIGERCNETREKIKKAQEYVTMMKNDKKN
jgi:hypothetical protein